MGRYFMVKSVLQRQQKVFLNIRALSKFTPVYGRRLKGYTNSTLDRNKARQPIRAHPSKTRWRYQVGNSFIQVRIF